MKPPKLHPNEARTDLTNREIVKLLGGMIGALVQMSDTQAVHEAVTWWAMTPQAWVMMRAAEAIGQDTEVFADAQQRARENPETFKVPSEQDLGSLRVGDLVKLCSNGERFWVELVSLTDDGQLGGVPASADAPIGILRFARRHIFDVEPQAPENKH